MPFAAVGKGVDTASRRQMQTLTQALSRLEALVEEQSAEMAIIRADAVKYVAPQYVRHSVIATVHKLRRDDASRTLCGICITGATFRARRQDASKVYQPIDKIDDVPGLLLCDRCLKTERLAALEKEFIDAALSGDEVEE